MSLPKQILLELRATSGQHVVRIHNDVNKGVYNTNQRSMSSWVVFGGSPRDHRHHSVVIQMEESYLVILLPDYEEDGIEEFGYLRQEINVDAPGYLECIKSQI